MCCSAAVRGKGKGKLGISYWLLEIRGKKKYKGKAVGNGLGPFRTYVRLAWRIDRTSDE